MKEKQDKTREEKGMGKEKKMRLGEKKRIADR